MRSVSAVVLFLTVTRTSAGSQKQPHIITILSDDLGYFDAGILGNTQVTTPNLDNLIHSGLRLSHHYAYKYCSPSRRSFVTGRWPLHLGELNQGSDIDLRMQTLGDKLVKVGYRTVLIGKTHWNGQSTYHLPYYRGWQMHLGYLGGGESYAAGYECKTGDGTVNCHNYSDQLDFWHNDGPASKEYLGEYSTDLFTRLAVDTIATHNKSTPLWLHLNYQSVHNPQTSPPDRPTWNDDVNLVFLEVLHRMDSGIANVTNALKKHGMWEDTILLFSSDNGGASHGNNYPLRGGKYSPLEGGVRVLAFLNGGFLPSHLAGTTFHGLVHISDWYPTLCGLAGASKHNDPPSDKPEDWFYPVDGVDVWQYIQGGSDPRHGSAPIVLSSLATDGFGGGAMIVGKFKIVYHIRNTAWNMPPVGNNTCTRLKGNSTCADGSTKQDCLVCTLQKPCLYNVWEDDAEAFNLADHNPKLVASMNQTFTKLVYERRMPTQLLFTEENGWNCKAKWGEFVGPKCVCTKPNESCKFTSSPDLVSVIV